MQCWIELFSNITYTCCTLLASFIPQLTRKLKAIQTIFNKEYCYLKNSCLIILYLLPFTSIRLHSLLNASLLQNTSHLETFIDFTILKLIMLHYPCKMFFYLIWKIESSLLTIRNESIISTEYTSAKPKESTQLSRHFNNLHQQ